MRLNAALQGNLTNVVADELEDVRGASARGIRKGTDLLKGRLRKQVERAGMGGKLAKTWRGKHYRNTGNFDEAGFVYSKAPNIISAFSKNTTIRSKGGRYLAIPSSAAPKRGVNKKKKASPSNWDAAKFGPLRYVPPRKGRAALLVADENKIGKTGRATRRLKRTKTGKFRKGAATVVMFFLVRQVRFKKRWDVDSATHRVANILPQLILREFRD